VTLKRFRRRGVRSAWSSLRRNEWPLSRKIAIFSGMPITALPFE
jgi:hypothetical protein